MIFWHTWETLQLTWHKLGIDSHPPPCYPTPMPTHALTLSTPTGIVRCTIVDYQLRTGSVLVTVQSRDFVPGFGHYSATWQTTTHQASGVAFIATCRCDGDDYVYTGTFTREGEWVRATPFVGRMAG